MNKITNYIKIIAFIVIFILLMHFFGILFNPTGTYKEWFQSYTIIEFYKQERDTVDFLYVGNSCVYTGISPMEMYNNIGVTGYSLSTPRQQMWSSYYWIKEAFQYQKPQAVFLEVGEAFSNLQSNDELSIRRAIDSMKLGKTKLEMIQDDDFELSGFDKLTCIFPVLRYHSRWNKIDEVDFRKFADKYEYTFFGFLMNKNVKKYGKDIDQNKNKKIKPRAEEINPEAILAKETIEKMERIEKYCKDNNSELVLIKVPEPRFWSEDKSRIIAEYAKERGLKFIDLNYDENINIDWATDTQDGGDHLNLKGAEKVGTYLSNFIKSNFEIEDHREDIKHQKWNQRQEEYNFRKNNNNQNNEK